MATINYNGMELEEVTKPQIFDPPRKCLVWDENLRPYCTLPVSAIGWTLFGLRVLSDDGATWRHCAILPDHPKPRRATNRELSRWLAQGNGECLGSQDDADTAWNYPMECSNAPLREGAKVRKWSDTEWHEPDVDYLFGGDE